MITHKVSKTSGRESLKLFRHLTVAFVLFFVMQAGWGQTQYYWIGGTSGDWDNTANWSNAEGEAAGTGYPGDTDTITNDEVYIFGNVEVTIDSDITIGKLLIQSGTNSLTSNFTTKLSRSGDVSLTITNTGDAAINLMRCSGTNDVIGTLEINLPVICAGEIHTHSGTTLLVDNGVTLKAKNVIHSAGSGKPISKIQVDGTLDVSGGTLNLCGNGNPGATQLVVGTNGTVIAENVLLEPPANSETGAKIYSNTNSNGTTKITEPIINNGTIQVSNSFTIPNFTSGVTKPYSGNGTIELNGTNAKFTNNDDVDITVKTLKGGTQTSTVTGDGHTKITTATFNGTATVENVEITTATFKGTTTLNGTNTFTDLTASNLGSKTFTINGTQTINDDFVLSGSSASNKLTVEGTGSLSLTKTLIADSLNFTGSGPAISSGTAYASNSTGTPTGWIVIGENQYVWRGGTTGNENDWHTAQNWVPQTVPSGTSAEVIINSGSPEINTASGVTVKSIAINGGALSILSGSLTLESITLDTGTSVTTAADTSITITEDWALDNKITGAGKLILDAGKDFTIADGTTIDINVENDGNLTSSGDVIFKKSFKDTGSFTGAITFNGSEDQNFTPGSNTYSEINVVKTSGTLSVTGALDVTKLTLDSEEISITGNLTTGNGTQFTGNNQISSTGDISFTKALDADNDLTISAGGNVSFAETFTSNGDLSITSTSATGAVSFTGQCNIPGDFSVTSNTLSFSDSVSVKDFTINATTITSSDITVKGNWTNNKASNGFAANGGTVKLTSDNSDTTRVTLSGANTFYNLNLDRNVSVLNSNTISIDLIMHRNSGDAEAKGNIYFADGTKQTINGKFDFKGLTSRTLLAACGNASEATSGTWEIEYGTAEVQNVNLSGCKNSSTQAIVVADPAGTETNGKSIDGGGNTNFIFLGHSYTWDGGIPEKENDWNTAGNWNPASIPGAGSEITLPAGIDYYPVLSENLDLNHNTTYSGSILIEEGASFDLAGKNLSVGTITNNGKVRLTGAETITATMSNGTNANSTVEYYDTASSLATFIWDGGDTTTPAYNNLILLKPVSSSQKISVSGTVKIGDPDPANSVNAGSVTLYSDSPISLEDNVLASVLDFHCETKIKNIKVSDSVTFEKPVTLLSTSTITSAAGDKIYFKDTLNGATFNFTTETGNSKFDKTISEINTLTTDVSAIFGDDVIIGTLSANAATINCSKIETTGNQSYTGAVFLGSPTELQSTAGSISFSSTVDGTNPLKLTSSTGTSFNGDVGASSNLTSLEITGASNINCDSITTTGDQVYDGVVNLKNGGTTAITGANIDFKNTINGSNIFSVDATSTTFENKVGETTALSSLSVTGTANINCGLIKTDGDQTYNDEIVLQQNSSFTGSLITLNGSVSDNTTPPADPYGLTVNGSATTALGNGESISIPVQIYGSLTNTNTGTASFNNDIKVTVNVTDNGSWNSADGKKLIFNGTGAQTFKPAATTTYNSILIEKTGGSFTANTNDLQVTSFADSATNASTITFSKKVTIGSDVVFNTSNEVSFTNTTNVFTAGSTTEYHSITHTAGNTNIKGTLTAADVTLNKTNLTGTTNIVAYGNVTFANTTSGSSTTYANVSNNQDLTITTNGAGTSTTFNGDVGKTDGTKLKSLTINGNTNIKCTLIATTGNQTYNGDVNLFSNSNNSSVTLTTLNASTRIDYSGNITQDASKPITFTINSPTFQSTAAVADPSNPPPVTVECNVLAFSQDNTDIASANGAPIQITVPTITGSEKTVKLLSGTKLAFNRDVSIEPKITAETGSKLTAPSDPSGTNPYSMTFKSNINFANETFVHSSGTVILDPPDTLDTISVAGESTFFNLTAQNLGGKTITFEKEKTQTVEGKLILTGTSSTSKLYLRSSDTDTQWKIKCTGENSHDIEFVDVQDGWNTSETGTPTPVAYNLFAITSNDSGNNTKWNFPEMIYTWNGSTNNSWNTASNWTPSSIPGKGADVRIASVTSPASTLLLGAALDLTSTYKGSDYNGIITVNAGAVFDLAGNNLTVGTITNKGLVRLTGASTQTIHATMENDGSDSTVEYYGTGAANSNFAWDGDNGAGTTGKQYKNLIISRAMSQNTDEANKLDVSGTTSIIAGNDNSVSLDNSYNIFGGYVTLGKQSPATSAGTVTLNGTGTGGVAIFLDENVLAQNLTLNSNVQGGNLAITGPLTLNAATIITTGTQTYKASITLGNAIAHTLRGTQIIFVETGTLGGSDKLTLIG